MLALSPNGTLESQNLNEMMENSAQASVEWQNEELGKGNQMNISFCREGKTIESEVDIASARNDPNSDMSTPIAICGMALRLPGGVNSPKEFWQFLLDKRDGLCEVPETRYKIDSFYSESLPHSIRTRKGYFLQGDPAYFDADFFSLSSREAARMDPQQRQLLEVVWECLESAGETDWRGKDVGCFVGVYGEDWLELASQDPQVTDRYHVLGTGQFALSNRISYEFDFQGPSMTLQTGCSSSLVGLHEACQAIYSGECSSAIVAGTNLIFAPTMTTTMSENMVLSSSGICRTFDEKADGYGRGEAINAIFIKRLDEAVQNNDPIRAVIRATSTNCDGRTPSITTPGSVSQERLIRRAYKKANINDISQTAFFECHGTGTTIGDTSEASVVAKLFEENGTIIGAVKPNVGHSEGASGITSVIKAALCLENQTIAPNIFFDSPNPKIPFKEANLHVPTSALSWPRDRKERVSVNCFGIGGANAHAVLDSRVSFCKAQNEGWNETRDQPDGSRLLVVSARSPEALKQRIQGVAQYVKENPETLHDLAFTLSSRREQLKHRAFAVAVPNKPLDDSKFHTGSEKNNKLIFVFTGQGAQWPGMGQDLIQEFDSFREDMEEFDRELQKLASPPSWSIKEELSKSTSHVNKSEFSQPLCTAIQLGLVNILGNIGVKPSAVVGHSSGEIAAAYAAGAITARSALAIAYYRGKATESCEGKGGMVAVGIGRQEASPYLDDDVIVACENSPQNVTLSGDIDAIRRVTERIKEDLPDTLCRQLRVKIAYHSHHMRGPGESYEKEISAHIERNATMKPLFSSTISRTVHDASELGAAYWRRNLESPVLFSDAIKSILADPANGKCFVEVGPHSALAGPLRQIFNTSTQKTDPVYIPTLTRHADDPRSQMLFTAGSAYLSGAPVELEKINGRGNTLTDLPSYPWQHTSRHWEESRLAAHWRRRAFPHHEILGSRVVESSDLEPSWRNMLRLENVPWIWDHVLQGNVVFPAAGYISMAGEAIRQLHPGVEDYSIKDLVLKSPLLLKDEQVTEIITTLRPAKINDLVDSEWFVFSITAYDGVDWIKHCQGRVRSHFDYSPAAKCIKSHVRCVKSDQWYRALEKSGLGYGPTFRGLADIAADPVEFEADATATNRIETCPSRYTLHPTVIDQCLQLMSVALTNGLARRIDRLAIPAAIGNLYIASSAPVMRVEAKMGRSKIGSMFGDSVLTADDGRLLLSLEQAAFFTVQDSISNDSIVPFTSAIEWTADIGLTPPELWVPQPRASGEYYESSKDCATVVLLYILETADKLQGSTGIDPKESHMVLYKDWITREALRVRNGFYNQFGDCQKWVLMQSEERQEVIREVSSRWERTEYSARISCMKAVWENCVDFMHGTESPLDVLMAEKRLEKLYRLAGSPDLWVHPIKLMGLENPKLRILEVGAGTGGYTQKVLETLQTDEGVPLYSRYVFTDVSPGFIVAAKEEFGLKRNVEFQVLDISKPIEKQDFKPHSFDLVIASNVLHATPSIQESLKNVQTLLAPTGKLILHELSPESPAASYIMGVLRDWWIGETDNRSGQPYISPQRWEDELLASGFTGSEVYSYDVVPPYQANFTMVSGISSETEPQRVTVVGDNFNSPWISKVITALRGTGYVVNCSTLDESNPPDEDLIFMLELEDPFVYNLQDRTFSLLQQYMLNMTKGGLWVTRSTQINCRDPRYGLIHGIARTLRAESELDLSVFETDIFDDESAHALCRVFDKVKASRAVADLEPEYEFSYHDRQTKVGRCHWALPEENGQFPFTPDGGTMPKLNIGTIGLLDTLHWSETVKPDLRNDQVEIEVQYVGLNFRDILASLGLVGDTKDIGLEGSGIIRRIGSDVKDFVSGDRVCVLHPGMLQSMITTLPKWCTRIPDNVSLEEGATMPVVFATAMYSLIELCSLKKGKTVLIHSACGGVGIASIQVCQLLGAEVFATVGSEDKVNYLMTEFSIPRNRIFNSRTKEFRRQILDETDGRGVDIVLNSLAGELLHASWGCVAKGGRMVELGKRDLLTNGLLNMEPFCGNRAFFGVDLLSLFQECPEELQGLLSRAIEWISQGKIEPIRPRKTFPASQARDAFRYMQQGIHMGKVLIETPRSSDEISIARNTSIGRFSPQKAYLLVGGLGGLGRAISTWMVEKGARQLIYLSRSAGESDDDRSFLRELRMQGVDCICATGDVSKLADVENAVSKCTKPLAGVLQMSMNLKDRTFNKMTYKEWKLSLSPKVGGTFNLHNATKNVHLDFFVVLSSACGICGNNGQANYAAANTFLDSFALYRRSLGLPCSSLALGAVEDVGLVSRNPGILQSIRSSATYLVSEAEVMKGLEIAISRSRANLVSPTIVGLGTTKPTSDPNVRPPWNKGMRWALYSNAESVASGSTEASGDRLRALLVKIERDPGLLDEEDTQKFIQRELGRLITQHMANTDDLDDEEIAKITLDSLMSIEIRGWARRNLSLEISLAEITKAGTIGNLANVVIEQLRAKYCV